MTSIDRKTAKQPVRIGILTSMKSNQVLQFSCLSTTALEYLRDLQAESVFKKTIQPLNALFHAPAPAVGVFCIQKVPRPAAGNTNNPEHRKPSFPVLQSGQIPVVQDPPFLFRHVVRIRHMRDEKIDQSAL